jgi:hypothetical protein
MNTNNLPVFGQPDTDSVNKGSGFGLKNGQNGELEQGTKPMVAKIYPFYLDPSLLDKAGFDENCLWLLLKLAKRMGNGTRECWPSLKTICDDTGWGKNTVLRTLAKLIELEIIHKQKRAIAHQKGEVDTLVWDEESGQIGTEKIAQTKHQFTSSMYKVLTKKVGFIKFEGLDFDFAVSPDRPMQPDREVDQNGFMIIKTCVKNGAEIREQKLEVKNKEVVRNNLNHNIELFQKRTTQYIENNDDSESGGLSQNGTTPLSQNGTRVVSKRDQGLFQKGTLTNRPNKNSSSRWQKINQDLASLENNFEQANTNFNQLLEKKPDLDFNQNLQTETSVNQNHHSKKLAQPNQNQKEPKDLYFDDLNLRGGKEGFNQNLQNLTSSKTQSMDLSAQTEKENIFSEHQSTQNNNIGYQKLYQKLSQSPYLENLSAKGLSLSQIQDLSLKIWTTYAQKSLEEQINRAIDWARTEAVSKQSLAGRDSGWNNFSSPNQIKRNQNGFQGAGNRYQNYKAGQEQDLVKIFPITFDTRQEMENEVRKLQREGKKVIIEDISLTTKRLWGED